MIDYENLRETIVSGLKKHLGCPVIRSNQNIEPPPYPYVSYTIITLMGENNGTYGEYKDGMDRKPFTQTWSISALSDDDIESVTLAVKAREWLDRIGTTYMSDRDVVVQHIGSITNPFLYSYSTVKMLCSVYLTRSNVRMLNLKLSKTFHSIKTK